MRGGRQTLASTRSMHDRMRARSACAISALGTGRRRQNADYTPSTAALIDWFELSSKQRSFVEGSAASDSESGVRPPRTRSTICCRYSGEYGGRLLGIVSSSPKSEGVHETGSTPVLHPFHGLRSEGGSSALPFPTPRRAFLKEVHLRGSPRGSAQSSPEESVRRRGTGTELLLRLGKRCRGWDESAGETQPHGPCREARRRKRGGVPTPTRSSARGLCHVVPIAAG